MAPLRLVASATSDPSLADWLQGYGSVAAVVATLLLLAHEMREARRYRRAATRERSDAAADRQLAIQDRELANLERRDEEATQARAVLMTNFRTGFGYADEENLFEEVTFHVTVTNFSPSPILDVAAVRLARPMPCRWSRPGSSTPATNGHTTADVRPF